MSRVSDTDSARPVPALWGDPAPAHFDLRAPWWLKSAFFVAATIVALFFLDQPIALFARAHPIPDLTAVASSGAARYRSADAGRELMFLEQWGQGACSVLAVIAVALLDRAGRRRALAIAIGCLLTLGVTHLLKDCFGRSRPFVFSADGAWLFEGPAKGFHGGARWTSFPSAHTTAAFALASGLAWFYPRGRALFMALALTTATLRVLHTAHYLSDVLAGLAIGVFVMRLTLGARIAGRLIAAAPPNVRAWWLADGGG
jgi:undecaprenyl-diphosphatase